MSRSEIAQSIDESTHGKVTHRQGDFNRKLGNRRVPKSHTTSIFTAVYILERRRKFTQLVGQKCSFEAAGLPELMPQPDHADRPQPSRLHLPGRADR
jgi:hypothetical protein